MRTDRTRADLSTSGDDAHQPPPLIHRVAWTAVLLMLVVATLWGEFLGTTGVPVWVDVTGGALAGGLVVVLFHRPLTGALLLAVLAGVTPAATPPATAATLYVARFRRLSVAIAVAAVGVLAHVERAVWRPPLEGISFTWWLILVIVAYAALVGWGALSRARHALIAALAERARRAEAEQGRRIAEARAAERTRIAREMHDVLAHRLSLVATYAGALEYRPDASPQRLSQAAGVIRSGVHEALEELRDVISVLRHDPDDRSPVDPDGDPAGSVDADRDGLAAGAPQPTLHDLSALLDQSRAAGMRIDVEAWVPDGAGVPAAVGRTAYRILQEALTNARKHASDQPVVLALAGGPGSGLTMEVSNPVPARSSTDSDRLPSSGTGLVGMAERVRLAGGTLEYELAQGRFALTAWLPWPT